MQTRNMVELIKKLVESPDRSILSKLIEEYDLFSIDCRTLLKDTELAIARQPNIVDKWIDFSADPPAKDCYFISNKDIGGRKTYVFLDYCEDDVKQYIYYEPEIPCATFIVNYLEAYKKIMIFQKDMGIWQ